MSEFGNLGLVEVPGFTQDTSDVAFGGYSGQTDRQTLVVTDLICEGPIYGLVEGTASIYLNNDRAVTLDQAPQYLNPSPLTVTLDNGSSTATINNALVTDPINTPATGTKHLIIRSSEANSVTVNASWYNSPSGIRSLQLVSNTAFFTSAMVSPPWTGNTSYRPVRIYPVIGGDPIEGYITELITSTVAVFIPTAFFLGTNHLLPEGDHHIQLDSAIEISSISGTTITLAENWSLNPTGTPVSYFFDVTGAENNDLEDVEASSTSTYRSVQTQFRIGTLNQAPFSGYAGVGSTVITNQPSLGSILWTTGFGGSSAPQVLGATATNGFNLSASQIQEVDEVHLSFNYPGGLYAVDSDGDDKPNYTGYKLEAAFKASGSSTFGSNILLQEKVLHVSKNKNALAYTSVIDLSIYKPFDDFKVIVSRRTNHGDPAHKNADEKASKDWSNSSSSVVGSVSSILKENLNHPYSAMAKVSWSTKEFQTIPQRTYHLRGLMVQVPSNYVTREETGTNTATYNRNATTGFVGSTYQDWDASFRKTLVYTNNPAWTFYDILTNNRYGLGDFLKSMDIDKYALYRIGRYCDELVPDGKGGFEPRFTLNAYFTKSADAYKVLKDMATVFRGMLYYIDGKVMPVMDAPSGPVYNFTKGNIIDGAFSYEGTGSKTRINQVIVSWNNPDANYKLEPLLVEDRINIAETGKIISQTATAFGATSQGQALRYGRWKLWTAANQREVASFATAINASYLTPGDIVNIQDADRTSVRYSGRVSSNLEKMLTLSASISAGNLNSATTGMTTTNMAQNTVCACDVVLPSSFVSNEVLWERGGSGVGALIGVLYNSGSPQLVLRAGDGQASVQSTDGDAVVLKVLISDIPEFDGGSHTVIWEMMPGSGSTSAGSARVWIDGRLIASASTTDASGLEGNVLAGTDSGGYGTFENTIAGEYTMVNWSGALHSDLRVYNNQAILENTVVPLDANVTLNTNSTYELSVLVIKPGAFLLQETAMINSVSYKKGDLIKEAFIDSNSNGTYTLQTIESEEDVINAKSSANSTDGLSLSWQEYTRVETETVTSSAGSKSSLTVDTAFTSDISAETIWVLNETLSNGLESSASAKEYKILAISQNSKNQFNITAVEHYDEKFDAVDNDFTTYIGDTVFPSVKPTDIVPPVLNVYVSI